MKNITKWKKENYGNLYTVTLKGFRDTFKPDAVDAVNNIYESLKNRDRNPAGTLDKAGRFYLSDDIREVSTAREPSRAYPYSEMNEGRTRKFLMKVWIHYDLKTQEQLEELIYS